MKPSIEEIINALHDSWMAETSNDATKWSGDNPARGQCVVSSLVVQNYLGGDLRRYRVSGAGINETHYCNVLEDGTVLDTTASQYTGPVTLRIDPVDFSGYASVREKRLAEDDTRKRYELLLSRVEAKLSRDVSWR